MVANLRVESLSIAYGLKLIVEDICIEVKPGEVAALIGPNGVGKTSLIRAISGVLPSQRGQVFAGEADILSLSAAERARRIAVVPQAKQYGGAFSVRHSVSLGRTAHLGWLGNLSPKDEEKIAWALGQTGLTGMDTRRLAELSGGERQRVFLARALAQDAPILLMDEPTNNLDIYHQIHLMDLVRELADTNKLTVLMAMHDLNLVSGYADRVYLLSNRKVAHQGKPEEVITSEHISAAYGIRVEVVAHPASGAPIVFLGAAAGKSD